MEPIIQIKNVNFTYNKGKDNEFQALIDINLDIYPEEFVILFGPSGCGKSSLLNIMAGLEFPDSGSIMVGGKDLAKMTKSEIAKYHRSQMGMVYQQYNLITSLTVLDNVALPQMFINASKRKREQWAKTLLERFGILQQANKIPTELSGGQQQRIGIARSIVNNPSIVLADEPVGNLDSVSAKNVLDILADLNDKEKKTIILVTHNPENLEYGDRIIYLKDGVITQEVVNKEKHKTEIKKETPKSPAMEINELMRAYQGLTPGQINILIMPYKAKVFSHHFITTRNMEETKIFEEAVQRKLLGTITQEEFFDVLHRTYTEGGVGFDKRTAKKIMEHIDEVLRMAYFMYQKARQRKNAQGGHDIITDEERAKEVTDYLLHTCYEKYYKKLKDFQLERLVGAVQGRILGNIHKTGFFSFVDLSIKEGGVGLNTKTAKAITEQLELILIIGFGMVSSRLNIAGAPLIGEKEKALEAGEEKKKQEERIAKKEELKQEKTEEIKKEEPKQEKIEEVEKEKSAEEAIEIKKAKGFSYGPESKFLDHKKEERLEEQRVEEKKEQEVKERREEEDVDLSPSFEEEIERKSKINPREEVLKAIREKEEKGESSQKPEEKKVYPDHHEGLFG